VPIRRDGEGKPTVGPTWESLTERLIREAMERGEFDDLPYKGERLPIDDDTYAGDNALAFHVLRNAGAAPPWIEADKEARRQLEARDRLLEKARHANTEIARERLRSELSAVVAAANAAIDRLNAEAPNATLHRRRLDSRVETERLQAGFISPSGLR
jgi:hypothetical protein